MTGLPPNGGWSDRTRLPTVLLMAGTDGARTAFRRRLGQSIAAFRAAHGDTQQALADYLEVDLETVGRWERGSREPKAYELNRIAARYLAPPDWLLNPTDLLSERDARAELLRQVASEAARADVADALRRRGGGGTSPQRGRARA